MPLGDLCFSGCKVVGRCDSGARTGVSPDIFFSLFFWLHWVLVAACGLLSSCGMRAFFPSL